MRNCRVDIMRDLEQALAAQAPAQNATGEGHQHDLPALVIDGIPTPLDKMTQVMTFIYCLNNIQS